MTIDAFDPLAAGRTANRNPCPALRREARAVAHAPAAASYVETIFLGAVVTAVASVLPLVMLLHR